MHALARAGASLRAGEATTSLTIQLPTRAVGRRWHNVVRWVKLTVVALATCRRHTHSHRLP
eukprot:8124566-Pyramimonas_sp.AAC.1